MKVYIVETYSGDDHSIQGVFDTPELAHAYIKCFVQENRCTEILITKMDMNYPESYMEKGFKSFRVFMHKNGTISATEWIPKPYGNGTKLGLNTRSMVVTCFAKDEEQAIAKAEEIRKQVVGDGIWCD